MRGDSRTLSVASSFATLVLAAAPSAMAAQCVSKIVPVQLTIEIFDSSTAPKALRQIASADLPSEICWVRRENSRYQITVTGQEVWVATVQFAGIPARVRPFKEPPDRTPAGVKLGSQGRSGIVPASSNQAGSAEHDLTILKTGRD